MGITEEGKRISDVLATWVTILSFFVGAIFTWNQYSDAKRKERVERTMAQFARFNDASLLQHRLLLERTWESSSLKITRVLTAKNKSSQDISRDYAQLVRNLVLKDGRIQDSVISLMGFLEGVSICVKEKLCENSSVNAFFGRYGKSFFRQYYPFICLLRDRWKDASIGLELEQYFNPKSVGKSCVS